MKNKIIVMLTFIISLFAVGAGQSFIKDQARIYNQKTNNLVEKKNQIYQKTKAKPHISLVSVTSQKEFDKLRPTANNLIIATLHQKKNNVQILVGKNQKKVFSDNQVSNIIRYAGDNLRSSNNSTFNKGIRTVFNACTTLLDQKYNFPGDKNTLTKEQMQRLNHPQSMNLVWGLVVAVIATFAFTWYQHWRIKN